MEKISYDREKDRNKRKEERNMNYLITDAFSDKIFGGNPAGVVLIPDGKEYPEEEIMQKTAAELRYSETAFIRKLGEGRFQFRYFTPVEEVDLCGHATIGGCGALEHLGLIREGDEIMAETRAGELRIGVKNGKVLMDMAEPKRLSVIDGAKDLEELYGILGIQYDGGDGLFPEKISTGLPDIMLPVKDHDTLDRMNPDMAKLSKLSEVYGVTGVHAFTLDAQEGTFCSTRNFSPLCGIDEEAATGTASGALTYYFYLHKMIGSPSSISMIQGEIMGRPSKITAELAEMPDGVRIRIGGNTAVLAEGEIYIG